MGPHVAAGTMQLTRLHHQKPGGAAAQDAQLESCTAASRVRSPAPPTGSGRPATLRSRTPPPPFCAATAAANPKPPPPPPPHPRRRPRHHRCHRCRHRPRCRQSFARYAAVPGRRHRRQAVAAMNLPVPPTCAGRHRHRHQARPPAPRCDACPRASEYALHARRHRRRSHLRPWLPLPAPTVAGASRGARSPPPPTPPSRRRRREPALPPAPGVRVDRRRHHRRHGQRRPSEARATTRAPRAPPPPSLNAVGRHRRAPRHRARRHHRPVRAPR